MIETTRQSGWFSLLNFLACLKSRTHIILKSIFGKNLNWTLLQTWKTVFQVESCSKTMPSASVHKSRLSILMPKNKGWDIFFKDFKILLHTTRQNSHPTPFFNKIWVNVSIVKLLKFSDKLRHLLCPTKKLTRVIMIRYWIETLFYWLKAQFISFHSINNNNTD